MAQRTREIGLLRAVGTTRRHAGSMIQAEAVLVAIALSAGQLAAVAVLALAQVWWPDWGRLAVRHGWRSSRPSPRADPPTAGARRATRHFHRREHPGTGATVAPTNPSPRRRP